MIETFLHRFKTEHPLYSVAEKFTIDPYNYHDAIKDFIRFVYDSHWVIDGYPGIGSVLSKAENKLVFISQLNKEDALCLIGWYVRGDRFTGGLLAMGFKEGYIQTALERIVLFCKKK